jgi:hypothetical protein
MTDQTADETTVHACPPPGSGLTPCCGRTPFELPPTDRMSLDPTAVTCSAAPAVQAPAADRAALRDRIAETLAAADGWRFGHGFEFASMSDSLTGLYRGLADAVLAVLPAPTDRAAVLREAADAIEAEQTREEATAWAQSDEPDPEVEAEGAAVRARAALLRRMADEAQPGESR